MVAMKLYVVCPHCGHRNLPDNSYRKAIRVVLLCQMGPCRKCGRKLGDIHLKETKAVKDVRQQLEEEGLLRKRVPMPASTVDYTRLANERALQRAIEDDIGVGFATIFTAHPEMFLGIWPVPPREKEQG